ncbi:MAG TPA: HEAT repeat domain-containing protein, partial [Pyrinomonadaceae bacterium]|nr:HEAT repeat domain-containing protein [Pyrinomonadaceae bacterium]
MTRIRRSAARFRLAVIVALVLAAIAAGGARGWLVASANGQDLRKFNQFVQTSNSPSIILLREGRDLVDGEEWAKAEEKFDRFINTYPKDKDVDVALYWLAYSLKRQGKLREASGQLARLLRDFPKSAWAEEATAMLTEIAPQIGDRRTIDESLNRNDEEIKIVALQSLFESSPERAVAYVTEIIKPGSTASRSFKETAVSLLGSHGEQRAVPILLDIARNQTDRDLRVTAFRHLADMDSEALTEDLMRLYDAERDLEVKENYLHAFENMDGLRARAKLLEVARSSTENAELRKTAIRVLGNRKDAGAFDELTRLYEAESSREVKEQILQSLADMDDPRARGRLLDIARKGAGDAELRKTAIRLIGDQEG